MHTSACHFEMAELTDRRTFLSVSIILVPRTRDRKFLNCLREAALETKWQCFHVRYKLLYHFILLTWFQADINEMECRSLRGETGMKKMSDNVMVMTNLADPKRDNVSFRGIQIQFESTTGTVENLLCFHQVAILEHDLSSVPRGSDLTYSYLATAGNAVAKFVLELWALSGILFF